MIDPTRKVLNTISENDKGLDERVSQIETREYSLIRPYVATSLFLNAVTLTVNVLYTTVSVPDTLGIPAYTRGVMATFWIAPQDATSIISFAPSGTTPDLFSQRYYWYAAADTNRQLMSQNMWLTLGTDGKINILATTGTATAANMTIFGYWL